MRSRFERCMQRCVSRPRDSPVGFDLGFEFETGMMAVYFIAGDHETLGEIYRMPLCLDEHLTIHGDDANVHTKKLTEPYHNHLLRLSGLFAEKKKNRTWRLQMKTHGFSHVEFQFLKGYHELEDMSRLREVILGDIRSATESIRKGMQEVVMGRLFAYDPHLIPDFCYNRIGVMKDDLALLIRRSAVSEEDTVRIRFQEQMTVGTSCNDVFLMVGLLFQMFLERTPDGFSFQKSVFMESFIASYDDTDTTRSGIRWMMLYNYLTQKKKKVSLFFVRCSMRRLLECFPEYRDETVSFLRAVAPTIRKRLSEYEEMKTLSSEEDYIQNVVDPTKTQTMVGWATYYEPSETDKTILIEFRALHKILRRHVTLEWTSTGVTVQTAELADASG